MCRFLRDGDAAYPQLVETNLRGAGEATLDLLESGATADPSLQSAQYPPLRPASKLEEPILRALSEVGALHIDPAGDMAVEPGPAALLRGLARLALPARNLLGIVNAARKWRGQEPLSESEFHALDAEFFLALKKGLTRALGEEWFRLLDHASSLASRALVLPCTLLRGSQEFYEEGIDFYRTQGNAAALYVYSTTSGLIIPREFHGDAAKNHYRYQYFTEGILGPDPANRIYQWEGYRTAKDLAKGYAAAPTRPPIASRRLRPSAGLPAPQSGDPRDRPIRSLEGVAHLGRPAPPADFHPASGSARQDRARHPV